MKIEFYHIDAFEIANYESIWRALIKKGIDAKIVAVPCGNNTAEKNWFDFNRFQQYCKQHQIPFSTTSDPTADIAITTQNVDILRQYQNKRVRLMYGPIVYPQAWGLQKHSVEPFDAVLTHGPVYQEFFSTWSPREKLPIIGYPRLDDFFSGKLSAKTIRTKWGLPSAKPILAFLPTWGDNTAFEKFLPALIKLQSEYHILARPHHCTLRFEPHRMDLLKGTDFTIIDNAFDLIEVYAAADVVLADVRSGSAFESMLCHTPTIGLVKEDNEMAGWLAQYNVEQLMILCSNPKILDTTIHTALNSPQNLNFRTEWSNMFVSYRDGNAADKAAEALIAIAMADKYKNAITSSSPRQNFISHDLTLTAVSVGSTNLANN